MTRYIVLGCVCLVGAGFSIQALAQQPVGSACTTISTVPQDGSTHKAFITGMGGERTDLWPRHPELCINSTDPQCTRRPYLITGDIVRRGVDCDRWTLVSYDGKHKVSVGWVLTEDLAPLPTEESPVGNLKIRSTVPAVCSYIEERLDSALVSPTENPVFESSITNIEKLDKLPGKERELGQVWGATVGDATVGTVGMKVLSYSAGGTCNSSSVELWNKDFTTQLALPGATEGDIDDAYPDEFGGYGSQELIKWKGALYFLNYSRARRHVHVFSIHADLSSEFLCSLSQVPLKQELTRVAANPELCRAALAGKAEELGLGEDTSKSVEAGAIGAYVNEPADSLSLTGHALLDIQNEGKPVWTAMASRYYASGAGCGGDERTDWPVILNVSGLPDQRNPFNQIAFSHAGRDDEGRLLRYDGSVVFEHRSLPWSDERVHEIWRFKGESAELMCSFTPIRYHVETVGSGGKR